MKMRTKYIARIIILLFFGQLIFMSSSNIANAYYLSDINGHWASTSIKKWINTELINGYDDGTFKPNNYITRAEFVALLNRVMNISIYNDIYYSDISQESWYYVDMAKAISAGYLKGYDDNTIRPNNFITREEVASVLYNTSTINNIHNPDLSVLNQFIDNDYISLWSKNSLASAVQNGFITGYSDNTIRSSNNITRAETIIILDRIFGDNMESFKVVGYYSYWTDRTADEIPYDGLTHINYAFAVPNMDGTVDVENPRRLQQLVTEAHANGVEVYIAIGGWGYDKEFSYITSDNSLTQTFIESILDIVREYDLDGVDIDWEYPDYGNEPENFVYMMSELRGALDEENKGLTAAITAGVTPLGWPTYTGMGISDEIIDIVDWLNLMVYDGQDGVYVMDHSPFMFAVYSIDYWVNDRGFPEDKLVLGVPFYGNTPDWMSKTYENIVKEDPTAPYKDYSNGYYYNGIDTIRDKTRLALDEVGGIMIWELSQDTTDENTSLLKVIVDEVNRSK